MKPLQCASSFAGLVIVGVVVAGPEWPEMGDAASLPPSAQPTTGSGALDGISGELTGFARGGANDFEDAYKILIKDPINFSASTSVGDGGSASFNTQLFLFETSGAGLLGNDDDPSGTGGSSRIAPPATDGTGQIIPGAGEYILAISGLGNIPTATGLPIFDMPIPGEISGRDGAGGSLPVSAWSGPGETGTYRISLEGASFVPAPAAATALLVGLSGAFRRRRTD